MRGTCALGIVLPGLRLAHSRQRSCLCTARSVQQAVNRLYTRRVGGRRGAPLAVPPRTISVFITRADAYLLAPPPPNQACCNQSVRMPIRCDQDRLAFFRKAPTSKNKLGNTRMQCLSYVLSFVSIRRYLHGVATRFFFIFLKVPRFSPPRVVERGKSRR